jgi:hypothetical protein
VDEELLDDLDVPDPRPRNREERPWFRLFLLAFLAFCDRTPVLGALPI